MSEGETQEEQKDYQVLGEDYPTYDYSFKIIVIGNSGKLKILIMNRCWKIIFINTSISTYLCR